MPSLPPLPRSWPQPQVGRAGDRRRLCNDGIHQSDSRLLPHCWVQAFAPAVGITFRCECVQPCRPPLVRHRGGLCHDEGCPYPHVGEPCVRVGSPRHSCQYCGSVDGPHALTRGSCPQRSFTARCREGGNPAWPPWGATRHCCCRSLPLSPRRFVHHGANTCCRRWPRGARIPWPLRRPTPTRHGALAFETSKLRQRDHSHDPCLSRLHETPLALNLSSC
mmetsp:Transcript_386/g.1172  ORF Transcript_386/g.1172 Transcript_386/m.1172 type:complete len:220 (+) Transcript_386:398-1057(+)